MHVTNATYGIYIERDMIDILKKNHDCECVINLSI